MRILGDGSKQTTWRNSFSSQSWLNRCRRRWSKLRERRSNLKWWGGERRKHDTQTWNFMFISCNHLEMLPRLLAASDAFICFPSLRRGFGGRHDALMIYLLDLFYVSHRSVKSKNFIVISSSFFFIFYFLPQFKALPLGFVMLKLKSGWNCTPVGIFAAWHSRTVKTSVRV